MLSRTSTTAMKRKQPSKTIGDSVSALSQPSSGPGSAQTSEALTTYLGSLIETALQSELHPTALFLSERLAVYQPQSECSAYFLAVSLYRNHLVQGCIYVLRSAVDNNNSSQKTHANTRAFSQWRAHQLQLIPAHNASNRCALLYAQACAHLGRPTDGHQALSAALDKGPPGQQRHPGTH